MKLKHLIVAAALLAALPMYSQKEALKAITLEESERRMKYLSSDELEGRRTGSTGNDDAAEYIREEALKLGLKPLPGQDDLFQPLDYLRTSLIPGESEITLTDSISGFIGSSEIMPLMPPSDTINLEGEVVFAGYGYMNSSEKYNDFAGISVKDKIVIVMTRIPEIKGNGMPRDGSGISEMTEARKLPMIMLQQAKAVLFVADPALGTNISADLLSMGSSYQLTPLFRKQAFSFNINAYAITSEMADRMLSQAGMTLMKLQDSIATTRKPASFLVSNLRARVNINVVKDTVTSNNIIGYIEGSDSDLRNEAVIFTAHYDHVGKDPAGNIFNGANDNASGSVGLLNIATAFAALEKKPARSLIFLWATGEEEGLHGSTYYTEKALFPLEKTVAAINFDMIGRSRRETDTGASINGEIDITGPDSIKVIHGTESPELVAYALKSCRESGIHAIDEGKGTHFSGSDHYPFYRKKIPVLFFFTGLHKDYHKQTDDYEFIDFSKLLKVSRAGFMTGYRVANNPYFSVNEQGR
ncbi:MAG: M20/M25/M40 family metallo-hydrolase [Bacteroidetes bacterium]|nr:MAG: M20/M25/M40 family metallo-hydrolase [Bacteroidota bacterium]